MKTLHDVLAQDARAWKDASLLPEQYRTVIDAAVRPFREASKRDILPFTVENDPGVLVSRHINVVDIGDPEHGMEGTGGSYDFAGLSPADVPAYAIWKNIDVPWRHGLSAARGGFNVLAESGQAAAEKITETENEMLVKELGPVKGITKATGVATFASAGAWTTAGIAYQDIVKAITTTFGTNNVPRESAALLVSPAREADLFRTFTSTDAAQLERIQRFLPGGIYTSPDVADSEAFVYARTPTVLEYRVYQDLTVVPLPKVDENDRLRVRVIGAVHIKKPLGIVKITAIDA